MLLQHFITNNMDQFLNFFRSFRWKKRNILFFHHKNNSSTLSTSLPHVADDWHHAELEMCCLWYKQLRRHSSLFDHGVKVYSPMIIKTLVEWKLLNILPIWLEKRKVLFSITNIIVRLCRAGYDMSRMTDITPSWKYVAWDVKSYDVIPACLITGWKFAHGWLL